MKLLATVALSSLVLIGGPSVEPLRGGPVQEEMRWHGWVPGGQLVEINNVHGNVTAEAALGDEIEVIALKRGSDDPEQVSIEVVEHKGGVTICAVYPNANPDHPFDCRPSHGGGFRLAATSESEARIRWDNGGGGDILLNDLRVDFVVRLPKRLRFIGRTIDGDVSAHMLEQDVEAHSVRGDVRVDMSASAGAEVRAETATGRVSSEFPLSMRCDHSRGHIASGHVGRSHRTLRLKTATGNIHLQRVTTIF
jgi:Putative adhesin